MIDTALGGDALFYRPTECLGNRLPQLSFEVFRPLADPDTAEGLVKAVTMIPASGEFTYATEAVRKTVGASTTVFGQTTGGTTSAENLNALPDEADIVVALDRLQAMAPAVESVSLVVAWFGNDLRAGRLRSFGITPRVERSRVRKAFSVVSAPSDTK